MNIRAEELQAWIAAILAGCEVPDDEAAVAAAVLVDANLSGVDTHGVSRLRPYTDLLRNGHVNPRPRFSCEERAGVFVFDADRGLGQVAGRDAMGRAIEAAERRGTVTMTLSRIGHLGALGHFTAMAAEAGMVALLVQNGPPIMGLPGSLRPGIGNNPLAFSAPVPGRSPIVFDVATSEAAYGKVIEAARAGGTIPDGWALDREGQPTTDAKAALRGTLLPAGGHKGIGLAMLVELLAGSLTGMVPAQARPEGKGMPAYFGAFLLVANPELIVGRTAFDAHLSAWLDHYKGAGPDARYPGEGAAALRVERRRTGVPLGAELAADLAKLGQERGVPFPGRPPP